MPKITVHGGPSIAEPYVRPGEESGFEQLREVPGSSADESPTGVATDYQPWTVTQLADELGSRGLPKSGTKAELVARLERDDHDDAHDAPGEE
jgi:hypothetical protein